jgi:hypothetical protein
VCDLENLVNEEAIARVGLQRHMKKKIEELKSNNELFTNQYNINRCAISATGTVVK